MENTGKTEELSNKTEEYYRKIMELANEKNIPIVVIVNPYPKVKESEIRKFNKGKIIAEEYGVDFYDYSISEKEFDIDYSEDAADMQHLNYKGNQKYSHIIGAFLVEKYKISDRKGDKVYSSWDENAKIT